MEKLYRLHNIFAKSKTNGTNLRELDDQKWPRSYHCSALLKSGSPRGKRFHSLSTDEANMFFSFLWNEYNKAIIVLFVDPHWRRKTFLKIAHIKIRKNVLYHDFQSFKTIVGVVCFLEAIGLDMGCWCFLFKLAYFTAITNIG